MAYELDAAVKQLSKTDEKINEASQQLVLKHEYRRILDKKEKQGIKRKWKGWKTLYGKES